MANGGVTEVVADVVETAGEDIIEVAESVREIGSSNMKVMMIGVGIGSVAGFIVGGLVINKKVQTKYEQMAEEEISAMREHFLKKERAAEPKPDLGAKVQELGYVPKEIPDGVDAELVRPGEDGDKPEVHVTNVFITNESEADVWDYEQELAQRTPDAPYVIHQDEFNEGNAVEHHEKATLTYFAEDDVLADERDSQIKQIDEMVGLENLEKFGHGSNDPNVVYIRNHSIRTDIEVVRSQGSYASEVHGVEEEPIEHSATRRHRSRRFDDD